MKVVLDTMFWLSYCTRKGGYRYRLIERARRQRVRIFVSSYILLELYDALVEDLGRSHRFALLARRAVLRVAQTVQIPLLQTRFVPGDPNDDPIIRTALSAKADLLVTADKEVLRLKKIHDVEIVTAAQFEERLRAGA